ncbi:GNAT family N-acetyltransferase [Cryptosporangium japonicum]|uniref:GNAT family N-acetyltransferase n=1 Tax=Cryptosporangium japonicum TaxID=80872 RepID=A0ABP3EQK4_9ACTN
MADARVTVDLIVRDLLHEDLAGCAWTGSPTRLRFIAAALGRRSAGVVDYLAVCGPSDLPLGIGGVDYGRSPGAGWLWQVVVHPAFRSCGIGTLLVRSAEERIRRRGLGYAELGVEPDNTGAQRLYARLGYQVVVEAGRRGHGVVMRRRLA